jgi:Fe2+ or Zn2+ uptake regulation protein
MNMWLYIPWITKSQWHSRKPVFNYTFVVMARYKYHALIKEILGDQHYTADDLYDMIKRKWHKVSLATVYRTLDYILGIGEITSFSLDWSKLYYEKNKWAHAHLIDRERNIILDVDLPIEKLWFPAWFRPNNSVINFFGSREGDVPPSWISLLQVISIDDSNWQEKWAKVPPTKNSDTTVDIITAKKIFREF